MHYASVSTINNWPTKRSKDISWKFHQIQTSTSRNSHFHSWGPEHLPPSALPFHGPGTVAVESSLQEQALPGNLKRTAKRTKRTNMEESYNLEVMISKVQGSVYWVAVFYKIDALLYQGHFDEWHTPIRFKFPHRSNLLIAEGLCQFGESFSELHQKRDGNYCCIFWTNKFKTHQQK